MQQTLPMTTITSRAKPLRRLEWSALGLPVTLLALLTLWQAGVTISGYPAFILPSPALVATRFWAGAQQWVALAAHGSHSERSPGRVRVGVTGRACARVYSGSTSAGSNRRWPRCWRPVKRFRSLPSHH